MRIFASPSRYIQGENALFENAKTILELGDHPILLCDHGFRVGANALSIPPGEYGRKAKTQRN